MHATSSHGAQMHLAQPHTPSILCPLRVCPGSLFLSLFPTVSLHCVGKPGILFSDFRSSLGLLYDSSRFLASLPLSRCSPCPVCSFLPVPSLLPSVCFAPLSLCSPLLSAWFVALSYAPPPASICVTLAPLSARQCINFTSAAIRTFVTVPRPVRQLSLIAQSQ